MVKVHRRPRATTSPEATRRPLPSRSTGVVSCRIVAGFVGSLSCLVLPCFSRSPHVSVSAHAKNTGVPHQLQETMKLLAAYTTFGAGEVKAMKSRCERASLRKKKEKKHAYKWAILCLVLCCKVRVQGLFMIALFACETHLPCTLHQPEAVCYI